MKDLVTKRVDAHAEYFIIDDVVVAKAMPGELTTEGMVAINETVVELGKSHHLTKLLADLRGVTVFPKESREIINGAKLVMDHFPNAALLISGTNMGLQAVGEAMSEMLNKAFDVAFQLEDAKAILKSSLEKYK